MSEIMPPVRFTKSYRNIYVDSAKIDVTIEWMRLNPQFLYELVSNEQQVRSIILFVARQKLFYDMRYNEARFRNELINALNNYFKHGRAEKIELSGWPPE